VAVAGCALPDLGTSANPPESSEGFVSVGTFTFPQIAVGSSSRRVDPFLVTADCALNRVHVLRVRPFI